MAEALYRKYRPRSLAEVAGQQRIVETLSKALKSGRIRHAYLFSGPKGVGKTSIARILAHEISELPYNDDSVHLDIIEIDAASNRRIDEIRDLRDKVNVMPAVAKYKVYIIDEVHMLTREAFNALLKTLEEPPAHSIFILATTEAHKLPETIISRTQHFTFKPIDLDEATKQLAKIANSEKINITTEALAAIAEYAHGSLRDSESLLDRLGVSNAKITVENVQQLIGLPPAEAIENLVKTINSHQASEALKTLDELSAYGSSPATIAKQLSESLRSRLSAGQGSSQMIRLLRQLLDVPGSPDPEGSLEISILEAAMAGQLAPALPVSSDNQLASPSVEPAEEPIKKEAAQKIVHDKPKSSPAKVTGKTLSLDDWPQVLDKVQAKEPGLYSALRLAKPIIDGNTLILNFEFALHQKKLATASSQHKLLKIIDDVSGASPVIESQVDKPAPASEKKPKSTGESLKSISNIFDGAEVLES